MPHPTRANLDYMTRVIAGAYTRDELRQVVRDCLDAEFDDLVADKPYGIQVFQLVTWAERHNRIADLVQCICAAKPTHPELFGLADKLGSQTISSSSCQHDAIAPSPTRVLLVFSRQDMPLMHRLRADLLDAGLIPVVDEQYLEPGTALWQRTIRRAIAKAQCMIIILSPEACGSPWVDQEIHLAEQRRLLIIPVLAAGDEATAVPEALARVPYVDLRSDYAGGVYGQIIPALLKDLPGD